MSGTFMDGGGHDQIGHGIQPGHGGGDGFMHDGGHHHQGGHTGGEGINIASLLGLTQHHQHGFIAHILGLDHNVHNGHSIGSHAPIGSPSQMPFWAAALQAIKPSTFFQGITVTANFWMAMMFLGFISWLFVVYWIRHHEPFSNAVLGTGAAQSATASYDRKIMAQMNEACPFRTSRDGGMTYAPEPLTFAQSASATTASTAATPPSSVYPQPAQLSPTAGSLAAPVMPQMVAAPVPAYLQQQTMPAGSLSSEVPMINVPVYPQTGTKIKTIVSR